MASSRAGRLEWLTRTCEKSLFLSAAPKASRRAAHAASTTIPL
ncbi:MAG: hypothetical protein AVDCRST_MAG04-3310 [uncultured Acetobacteraceae bacterium]|uniref:Uncharacterized protein n=1 Tax=uncultured Acetobacteraceae bacterium TaxID=169975 RepID=A0A6J4JCM7_9PROT|nr:MAG: hypothetical protein AVDCRST_MAG04-3310 [uncultured Acetobacteraceae bacterium]